MIDSYSIALNTGRSYIYIYTYIYKIHAPLGVLTSTKPASTRFWYPQEGQLQAPQRHVPVLEGCIAVKGCFSGVRQTTCGAEAAPRMAKEILLNIRFDLEIRGVFLSMSHIREK